jgi:hypothetical protein
MPLGLAPSNCRLVPFEAVVSAETSVQIPTTCSLSFFFWASALPGSRASPNTVIAEMLRMLLPVRPIVEAHVQTTYCLS